MKQSQEQKKTKNVWNNAKLQDNIQLYRKRNTTDKRYRLTTKKVKRKARNKTGIKNTKIYGGSISQRTKCIEQRQERY